MKLHLNNDTNILLIRGYQAGRITIGDNTYSNSLILSPTRLIDDWPPLTLSDLTEKDFERMIDLEPEVVLLGTGQRLKFPERRITLPLIQRSIGIEVMNTAAACRTYNILANEGRNVVASLIIEIEATEQPGQV